MQVLLTMPLEHHDSQQSGYSQGGWMNVPGVYSTSPPTTMSPIQEFPQYDYHNTAPMPMEPAAYAMPRPGTFTATHAPMPPPLIMPHSGLWPSMLASQPQPSYQTPILPAGPLQTPISATSTSDMTPTSAKTTSSRRKLTDDERRQMCIEAEQNPSMKQTQIGAKFNVERSTVSKILRQREKYMNPPLKEESTSPGKKSKAKLPDFEKTLTNWVKNQQKKGSGVTDQDLRRQAKKFSFSRSDQEVVSSNDWLEKFKRKNRLISQSSDPDSALLDSSTTSLTQTPLEGSPDSGGIASPSLSAIEEPDDDSDVKIESNGDFFDFGDGDNAFDHQSSLDHEVEEALSPATSQLRLSSLSPIGGCTTKASSIFGGLEEIAGSSSRQRSQTFPHAPNYVSSSRPTSSGQSRPALAVRSVTAATTAPIVESAPAAIDPRQMMKRHKSVPDIHYPEQVRYSSMQPPPLPRSADASPISHATSPTEDENIRALHAIKSLLEQNPSVAEPDDYLAIGKLMQKMKVLRPVAASLPGGMYPIDITESPRFSKKRTITGIST